ncbi:MAG: ASKHA domain-containing protein [Chloroflexota bacterium]
MKDTDSVKSEFSHEVTLQPIGRRISVPAGSTILDAARLAGVELVTICGGEGVCGTCKVRLVEGQLSEVNSDEECEFSSEEINGGFRLACQAVILSDVRIDIPPESFSTPQRLQVEGQEIPTELDPIVTGLDVNIQPASLKDLRADLTRLRGSLAKTGLADFQININVAAKLPYLLRSEQGEIRLVFRKKELVSILPSGSKIVGLAVDIGTTKLAAYLVDLETGETLAKAGAMNPQIAYGEDVISRISYANDHTDGAKILQSHLVETLNKLLDNLSREANIKQEQVVEAVMVGNTAMHHLFSGLPVKQLGESPYVAAVGESLSFIGQNIGLELAAGAHVYMPPNIAGYVGADHVAMLLGADLSQVNQTTIALDIGTNTEISLFHAGEHFSCSCASGPAFEGAHIQAGMRAAQGAIERVQIDGSEIRVQTIGDEAAVGICGSGILDVVAELIKNKLLDKRGKLKGNHPALLEKEKNTHFVLVPAEKTGTGKDVIISRQDINEIQLAKAAIRAGVEVLLAEAGINDEDIQTFIVAGAFGTYLDIGSAIQIGMFPDIPRQRFKQVGNAAGGGARKLLVSMHQRQMADTIAENVNYVELATHPDFMKIYVKALAFA